MLRTSIVTIRYVQHRAVLLVCNVLLYMALCHCKGVSEHSIAMAAPTTPSSRNLLRVKTRYTKGTSRGWSVIGSCCVQNCDAVPVGLRFSETNAKYQFRDEDRRKKRYAFASAPFLKVKHRITA